MYAGGEIITLARVPGRYMTTAEAGVYMGVSTRTIQRYITLGLLSAYCPPHKRHHKLPRISVEDMDTMIAQWSMGVNPLTPARDKELTHSQAAEFLDGSAHVVEKLLASRELADLKPVTVKKYLFLKTPFAKIYSARLRKVREGEVGRLRVNLARQYRRVHYFKNMLRALRAKICVLKKQLKKVESQLPGKPL